MPILETEKLGSMGLQTRDFPALESQATYISPNCPTSHAFVMTGANSQQTVSAG